jgi:hypothetical protein
MTDSKAAACRLIKHLGLVPSFRNLHIVELAITSESNYSSISLQEATDRIIDLARIALLGGECLNYFWFEDCCWRNPKLSYRERDKLRFNISVHGLPSTWTPCDGCTRTDGTHDDWCGMAHPEQHARVRELREKLDAPRCEVRE